MFYLVHLLIRAQKKKKGSYFFKKIVTIQDLHSQNARIYILANYEVDWLDILLIGRLLPSLPMCKLYYIRKRKRTTCTYAAAGPEQLQKIKNSKCCCTKGQNQHDVRKLCLPF